LANRIGEGKRRNADKAARRIGGARIGQRIFGRAFDWDSIREKHYGQRPCVPHKQAGHMIAPINAAEHQKKALANQAPSTHDR
jgi:hypothetical protein